MKKFGLYSPSGHRYAVIKKGLIIVKITLLLILISTFNLLATDTYSQTARVSLKLNQISLKQALKEIERSSEFYFLYNNELVDVERKVDIEAKNEQINTILDHLFANQGVKYTVYDKQIVISPANMPLPQNVQRKIAGKVTDQSGASLPGVTVVVKGTTTGLITDGNGNYSLSNIPENAVLQFSFIGMKSQEFVVGNKATVNVAMVEETIGIEEVVAIGYGTQKKTVVTGAVSAVNFKEISVSPTPNLTQGLAGQMPGVIINSRGGRFGKEVTDIFIRGKNTINDATPLYVIDGVVRNYEGLDRLDPNQIESITILKDASGAIYGSQAANGVILVTTKRGIKGKPIIDFSFNHGFAGPARQIKMADSYTFASKVNLENTLKGLAPQYTDAELQKFKDGSDPVKYPNTNWYDETLRKSRSQEKTNLSVRGGTDEVKYFLSLGMLNQDDPYIHGFGLNKQYNMLANIDANINKNLTVSFNFSGRLDDIITPFLNDFGDHAIQCFPTVLAKYPNGLYADGRGSNNALLMVQDKNYGYDSYAKALITNTLGAAYNIPWVKGLSLSGSYSYDYYKEYQKQYYGDAYIYKYNETTGEYVKTRASSRTPTPELSNSWTQSVVKTAHSKLAFKRTIAEKHTIDAFLGYEQSKTDVVSLSAGRKQFISGAIQELFAGSSDKNQQSNSGFASEAAYQNYFGRVLYDYMNKYMAQFQFRYDGSQNFPKENRFGFFPGISAGWLISKEAFMENVPVIDHLKLRASWGKMGNDKVAAFQYLRSYGFGNNYSFNGTVVSGLVQSGVPNPNITWETARTTDIGLETRLWKGQLGLEMDYFYTKRENILTKRNATVPSYVGLTLPNENIGSVENQGFELLLSHNHEINKDFRYTLSGNFTYAHSNVLDIDEVPQQEAYQKATGMPIGSYMVYEIIGIFDDAADVLRYPHLAGTAPGDLIRRDANNDGVINSFDRVRKGLTSIPEIQYGLTLRVGYKQFEIAATLQGQARASVVGLAGVTSFYEPASVGNFVSWFAEDGWTPENPTGTRPRPGLYGQNVGGTSMAYFNGAFLRLKNAEIAYNLPKALLSKFNVQACRVFVTGDNLISLDALKDLGIDIEMGANPDNLTPDRIINIGVNLTF